MGRRYHFRLNEEKGLGFGAVEASNMKVIGRSGQRFFSKDDVDLSQCLLPAAGSGGAFTNENFRH